MDPSPILKNLSILFLSLSLCISLYLFLYLYLSISPLTIVGECAVDYLGAGNSFNSANMKDRKHYIGIYSPQARKIRINKFIEKRKFRMWSKKVKYDVRKSFADSRVRVKGRFVKKNEDSAAGSITTTTTTSSSANKKQ